jgi:hypothetical protein
MKVYLVESMLKGGRYFNDENSLINFLAAEKNKKKTTTEYNVKVIEGDVVKECIGELYLNDISSSNIEKAEDKVLLSMLEDFKNLFKELAPNNYKKDKFLVSLGIIPINKKEINKFFKKWEIYLVYEVSSKIEWYRCILGIYSYEKVEPYHIREFIYKNGTNNLGRCKTSEETVKNFNKAKSESTKKPS